MNSSFPKKVKQDTSSKKRNVKKVIIITYNNLNNLRVLKTPFKKI